MPGAKGDDTQAFSTRDIKESGVNYKPRTTRNQAQQPTAFTPAVQFAIVVAVVMLSIALMLLLAYFGYLAFVAQAPEVLNG